MSTTSCDIVFLNNPNRIYFGGETIKAKAIVTLNKFKFVRGLYVEIKGYAHCEWMTGSCVSRQYNVGNEIYFSEKHYVIGSKTGDNTIQPDVYTYPFQCNLPVTLPTSVESKYGYIRYYIIFNIDHKMKPIQEFIETFFIINPLDLNVIPEIRNSVTRNNEPTTVILNNFYRLFCCCHPHLVKINVSLFATGYTPDEKIRCVTKIDNKSKIDYQFSVKLIKIIDFYTNNNVRKNSQSQTIREEIQITKIQIGAVRSRHNKTFNTVLTVPVIAPTDVISKICKVHYVLRVAAEHYMCIATVPPQLDIPIIIGCIPLTTSDDEQIY